MSKGSLREQMPIVTDFIDSLRAAFGEDCINQVMRSGIKGQPVFFATENGHSVGTPIPVGVRVGTDDRGNSALLDIDPLEQQVVNGETHRERHYREAYERSRAMTTAKQVQTSAQAPQGREIKRQVS